jgi:PKD repeat protein
MAGFSYFRPYSYDDQKYRAAFAAHGGAGLPYGPVIYNWGSMHFSHQKFTNGAIFLDNSADSAHWLGEGIWNKWVDLGAYESLLGIPECSEFPDMANNGFATVRFENGEIFWDGVNPFVIYYVHPKFTYDVSEGSAPLEVRFTDLTRVDSGSVTSWLWDFGDGTTSTEQNPMHLFETPGTFQVRLTVEVNNKPFSTTGLGFISVVQGVPGTAVSYMEYFFDQDPGLGQGIALYAGASPFVSLQTNISLTGLSAGLHRLYLRARDTNGLWSQLLSRPVLISPESLSGAVDRVEYFFDDQVANGAATALIHPASTDVSIDQQIDISALAPGMHRLFFRAKNEAGQWSAVHSRPLLVSGQPPGKPDITRVEYFFNQDPGLGLATPLPFVASDSVSVVATVPLADLSTGDHTIGFRAKNSFGLWSQPRFATFSLLNEITTLRLNAGWNIISLFIQPDPADLLSVFQPLIDAGILVKVVDEAGNSLENLGSLAGWVNSIGAWQETEGYKVYVTQATDFSVAGSRIPLPVTIPLFAGWNMISFPAGAVQDAMASFGALRDAGVPIKVMDEAGYSMEDLGVLGGWQNYIGDFLPGKGYKVRVNAAASLVISGDAPKSANLLRRLRPTLYFNPVFTGNGTNHFNLHLVDPAVSGLRDGDELALFDGALCVGSATLDAQCVESPSFCLTASANDGLGSAALGNSTSATDGAGSTGSGNSGSGTAASGSTGSGNSGSGTVAPGSFPNGFIAGHPLSLRLYRDGREWPLTVESLTSAGQPGPPLLFSTNGTAIGRVKMITTSAPPVNPEAFQVSYYPNPFSEQITLLVRIPVREMVSVDIHDQLGRKIRSLHTAPAQGTLSLVWDGRDASGLPCAPGLYFCRVNGQVLKIMLSRFPGE